MNKEEERDQNGRGTRGRTRLYLFTVGRKEGGEAVEGDEAKRIIYFENQITDDSDEPRP